MKRRAALALVAILVAPAAVHADEPRDPNQALAYSIMGTGIGAALLIPAGDMKQAEWKSALPLFVGAELAPSLGHLYAGDYLSPGLITRAVGGGLLILGLRQPLPDDVLMGKPMPWNAARIEVTAGLGLMIGGTIHDIVTARSAAHRYNKHHLEISPAPIVTARGTSTGLAVGGMF